jgi:hypothetical protein
VTSSQGSTAIQIHGNGNRVLLDASLSAEAVGRPLKVYVSSTLVDLRNEWDAVLKWLSDLRHVPYHSYVGNSESVRDSGLHDVEQCDLYILVDPKDDCKRSPPGAVDAHHDLAALHE